MAAIIYNLLIVLEAIVCLLLIGIVLLQKSKGDGSGLSFGNAEAVFGAQTGNVLTRGTVILAVIFLVNTVVLCILRPVGTKTESIAERIVREQNAEASAATSATDTAVEDILNTEPAVEVPEVEVPVSAPAAEAPAAEAPAAEAPAAEAPAAEAPAAEAPSAE